MGIVQQAAKYNTIQKHARNAGKHMQRQTPPYSYNAEYMT